jgi:hypothetical protein
MTPRIEQRSRRALRIAHGAELATVEAVEGAFGGEEVEAALVTRDDAGRPIADFNNIGFGHARSFAGLSALPSDSWFGLLAGIKMESATGSGRRGNATAGHTLAHIADCWLVIQSHAATPGSTIRQTRISDGPTNWSMKWLSIFAGETWQLSHAGTENNGHLLRAGEGEQRYD